MVQPPDGQSAEELFEALLEADRHYCDCLDYDVFPGAFRGEGYNSNSYVVGLIEAVGGTVDLQDYHGANDPVPREAFQAPP